MIITCPNCQARYQVASQTIGNAGRKVQCANCQTNWRAKPEAGPDPDTMFDAEEEKALDAQFEREELSANKQKNKDRPNKATNPEQTESGENSAKTDADADVDEEKLARQKRDLARRQSLLNRSLPKARLLRIVRMILTISLMSILGGGYTLRNNIVSVFPDLAGLYQALGIKVNVVGLEFRDVRTLRALRNGTEVMEITASITNVSRDQVVVPSVLISILDKQGRSIYQWSVDPQVVGMQAGEWVEFKTQLTSPPSKAASVRLNFVTNQP
ncbi:hypothetical protein MNBD_ALPHA12-1425 [hydrothermal vent metagenome]|uniref:Zinc finger/thioredoxin putative domain-containing protein n=1 Tax=hydrothermal vent metagenome TaxID=652676 RepID=A0A3B0TY35_9ZZZZ